MMSGNELQYGLIGLSVIAILGLVIYNLWQERRARKLAEQAFRSIGWRGRLLVVGFANGAIPNLPLNLALLKGATISGVFWGEFARREPQNNAACLMQLAAWYMEGKIKPVIEHKLPMSQLKEAFALMGTRQVRGKVVLVNS